MGQSENEPRMNTDEAQIRREAEEFRQDNKIDSISDRSGSSCYPVQNVFLLIRVSSVFIRGCSCIHPPRVCDSRLNISASRPAILTENPLPRMPPLLRASCRTADARGPRGTPDDRLPPF